MTTISELIAYGLADGSKEERYARAWSILSILIGAINIARAMKAAEEVAAAIINTAGSVKANVQDVS